MPVIRVDKKKDFTVMSNYHLRDNSLSLKAKGLLSYMLSLPDDWDYTIKGLAGASKDGIDSVSSGIKELEEHGYIERNRIRGKDGRLNDIEYVIRERPLNAESFGSKAPPAPEGEIPSQAAKENAARHTCTPMNECGRSESDFCFQELADEDKHTNGCVEQLRTRNSDPLEYGFIADHALNTYPQTPYTRTSPARDNPMLDSLLTENAALLNTKGLNTDTPVPRIYPSIHPSTTQDAEGLKEGMTEAEGVQERIREQIEYYTLCTPENCDLLDELVKIMQDVAMNQSPYVSIGKEAKYRIRYVQETFEQITSSHIQHVMEGIRANSTRVRNTKAYLMAALFNSVSTRDCHYTMLANHHMNTSEVVSPCNWAVQLE